MMPGFGEMAIILVIVLIFFGAGKLPEVFSSMGEGMRRFRDAQKDDLPPDDVTPKLEAGEEIAEAEEVVEKEREAK